MGERLIVGAGLSGLVASIILARGGHEVRVLEKYGTVGGQPERWPAVDVTPMDPEGMSRYLGIEIRGPGVKECVSLSAYLWGRKFDVPVRGSGLCCVERGARKTALDKHLYEIAIAEGVNFEFEHPVIGQGKLAALPPGTIVATGLYVESFDALNIPYQMGRCFGAKGRSERDGEAAIYFGDYTGDYGYWSSLNGIDMIFLFKRGPVSEADLGAFSADLESTEGLEAGEWLEGYGPTPTARFNNPRLFASDKILAGTLSGMMEPFVLFGVHGALVSGRIAAMAVEDPNSAWLEFRRCLHAWKRALASRKIYDHVSGGARRAGVVWVNRMLEHLGDDFGARALGRTFGTVPGYLRVNRPPRSPCLLPGEVP